MNNYKVTLETERFLLRLPTPDDFYAFHSWGSSPENTRYMSWGPNNEKQTMEFLGKVKPGRDFAVVLKDSGTVIGSCGIYPDDSMFLAELGWILHKEFWKLGYGTELAAELIRYGFEDLELGRIQARCAALNYASYRIMERNAMRREAHLRNAFWARIDNRWIDEYCYAILAEEFAARNNPLIGSTATVSATVDSASVAKTVGSGSLDVFATPMMIALMEHAACKALDGFLALDQTSVGTHISVNHTAASPIGALISATATVVALSGRSISFSITASDDSGLIGSASHTRVIVQSSRFISKALSRI